MKVIVFPLHQKATVEVTKVGDGISFSRLNNPYKDYKAFLKDNSYGGHYISKEEETTVGPLKATWLEVKFDKLTTPRRLIAWVYHTDDADYAVTFEILEDYWSTSQADFLQSLKSFKAFARKAAIGQTTTGDDVAIDDISKLTPEERAKRRAARFERELETAEKRLPAGWSKVRSKNYVALTHVDARYTQKVLDQAEAVRSWLEATFGWIGTGTPGSAIIRICTDSDEERAYGDTSNRSGWSFDKPEITMSRDLNAGKQSYEFQWVNKKVMHFWLRDKNRDVASAMPGWLQYGLDEYVMTAVQKGPGKLDFRPDDWELESLRTTAKEGKIVPARDALQRTWEGFVETPHAQAQSGALVRFLMDGPGKQGRSKGAIASYLKALADTVKEDHKDEGPDVKPATTEEEEDARMKAMQDAWKTREKELLDKLFQAAFGGWSEGDWKQFEAAYLRYVS